MLTQEGQVRRLEKIFWMMTLLARNMVTNTLSTSRQLAHSGWGLAPMNWGSLIQSSSRVERKGRRQPLKTCATRITRARSAENNIFKM